MRTEKVKRIFLEKRNVIHRLVSLLGGKTTFSDEIAIIPKSNTSQMEIFQIFEIFFLLFLAFWAISHHLK